METPLTLKKVLVAEDDRDIQKVIRMSLKLRGVEYVAFANDGLECLAIVGQVQPDLILLDVSMPNLDGYETCRRLKADPKTQSIPVVFLTAKVQRHEKETGMTAGAQGYLSKPFDPMTLHDQLLEILAKVAIIGAA